MTAANLEDLSSFFFFFFATHGESLLLSLLFLVVQLHVLGLFGIVPLVPCGGGGAVEKGSKIHHRCHTSQSRCSESWCSRDQSSPGQQSPSPSYKHSWPSPGPTKMNKIYTRCLISARWMAEWKMKETEIQREEKATGQWRGVNHTQEKWDSWWRSHMRKR